MTWSTQQNWRLCANCQGLWLPGHPTPSACPAGGTHTQTGSANYSLLVDASSAPGQSGWRRCDKCHGLWFGNSAAAATCPLGGTHSAVGSGNYTMSIGGPGQRDWRCCSRCGGLWFAGGGSAGTCPAGGTHDPSGSADISVVHVQSAVRIHTKVLAAPTTVSIETMLQNMRDVYAAGEIDVQWVSNEILSLPDLEDLEAGKCRLGVTTQEQDDLFAHRTGVGPDEIVVYFVRSTLPPYNGCASHPSGRPGAVVVQTASQWTFAHEVGHVLGLRHVDDNDRLMTGNGTSKITNPPPDLAGSEITTMNSSALTVSV
jgi:hypothetical protein